MVNPLSIERSTMADWGYRAVFAVALLITLSAFAKETATVAIDLPKPHLVHAAAVPAVASTPVPVVKAPAVVSPAPVVAAVRKSTLSVFSGMASWYGKVLDGHRTASGRRFNMFEMTAAHRSLPFGTQVKVTDLRNRKSIIVTITDRGVLAADRVIDLSFGAAQQLDMVKSGVDPVRLEVLSAKQALLAEAALPTQP